MKILFLNKTRRKISKKFFEWLVLKGERVIYERILSLCGRTHGLSLSVTLIYDDEMAKINKEWRGKKGPTDVLSFSFLEDFVDQNFRTFVDATDASNVHASRVHNIAPSLRSGVFGVGDILISVDTISAQAKKHGFSFEQELSKMFAHSFLHIFGYNHETVSQEREMECVAAKILAK